MILQIIGFSCLAHLVVDFISHFDLPELPQKPFKCDMCIAFWLSIIPMVVQYGLVGILYSAISGVLANYIYNRI
jgi:hypothetical protein